MKKKFTIDMRIGNGIRQYSWNNEIDSYAQETSSLGEEKILKMLLIWRLQSTKK